MKKISSRRRWSGIGKSNPFLYLGKVALGRLTNPAQPNFILIARDFQHLAGVQQIRVGQLIFIGGFHPSISVTASFHRDIPQVIARSHGVTYRLFDFQFRQHQLGTDEQQIWMGVQYGFIGRIDIYPVVTGSVGFFGIVHRLSPATTEYSFPATAVFSSVVTVVEVEEVSPFLFTDLK